MSENAKHGQAGRSSGWLVVLTLCGFLAAIAVFVYHKMQTNTYELEREAKIRELNQINKEKRAFEEQAIALETEVRYYEKVLRLLEQERPDLLERATEDPEVQKLGEKIKPRVHVHFEKAEQAEMAMRAGIDLEKRGFLAPDSAMRVGGAPQDTQVRYFRRHEQEEAEQLVRYIKESFALRDVKAVYFGEAGGSEAIRPRYYEIWFGTTTVREFYNFD